ncbi:YceI family protein [Rheinheimera soli]|uniref:Polyisoprenoid-binding protein YceI n=1 Tax=Rheinheimera soli TaxID=443616 RepID=A0ABU1VWA4_9GAMM|nr:YceI family protein [Rheinheimera soli]MDR7120011.1 polyisoprenoid-binding protein YceI [Rheinheimera soli]
MTIKKLALVVAAALSFSAAADWSVNSEQSSLTFVSVKNEVVAETHSFKELTGKLTSAGEFSVAIPVMSIDTIIPIRNERILEHVLAAKQYATINAKGKVDNKVLAGLKTGDSVVVDQSLDLTLLTQSQSLMAKVKVTKVSDSQLVVTTVAPIMLDVNKFKLNAGVEKLRELAGLNSISPMVPTTFSLVLVK